jgi:hypothetical protein
LHYLLTALTLALMLLVPLLPGLFIWRTRRFWVPTGAVRCVQTARLETLILFLVSLCVGFALLYSRLPASMPELVRPLQSETVPGYHLAAIIAAVGMGIAALVIARRFSTSVAVCLLIGGGLAEAFAMQAAISQHRHAEWQTRYGPSAATQTGDAKDTRPVKLRFELIDNVQGADVWMNGVRLGTTPIETTAQELFARVPEWSDEQIRENRHSRTPEQVYRDPVGQELQRWGWCPLHLPGGYRSTTQLYYRVELNGVAGYSSVVDQSADGPHGHSNTTYVITLDTRFPAWETAIENLFDQARMNDYVIDAQWLKTFDTYGDFATRKLQQTMREEPEFISVQQTRARMAWNLADVDDADSAWQRLMSIQQKIQTTGTYDSSSVDGVAVDLLVPFLNPQQLIHHAMDLLRHTAKPDPGSSMYDGLRFATYHDGGQIHGKGVSLWPIAHAIWRLDQQLDEERHISDTEAAKLASKARSDGLAAAIDPRRNNAVEQTITPFILRLSYGHEHRLKYASILGGSAYESFLLGNDWHRPATDSFDGVRVGDFENYVNKWYHRLMWLRSPLGIAFRRQQADSLLKVARNGFSDSDLWSGSFPADLNFLFLDHPGTDSRPSLAMRFWPDLDRLAKSAPDHAHNEMLKMRWNYLSRLWPESTTEMFIDSFHQTTRSEQILYIPDLPQTLSAEARFEILEAVLTAEIERVGKLPADPEDQRYDGPKYRGEQNIARLKDNLIRLPCTAAAQQLLSDLAADPKHTWWKRLPGYLQYDTQHEDLLSLMASSSDDRLQSMVLPAIEHHPTAPRRRLLETLLKSPHDHVREDATRVQQKLTALQAARIPDRAIPKPEPSDTPAE